MRVFVTGGTGLIGRRLLPRLAGAGHSIVLLTRSPRANLQPGQEVLIGDPGTPDEAWLRVLDDCDAVVHLAGEPLMAERWTQSFKQRLRDSRVNSTRWIATRLAQRPRPNRVFLCGSAIGYYGDRGDEELTEDSGPGTGFLADLCRDWEAAASPAKQCARTVLARTGLVLDPTGGTLKSMRLPMRLFAGGPLGSGRQWQSWIHIADMIEGLLFALENASVQGPVDFTAPEPIRNWGFAKTLGEILHRPSWLPTPAFALRLMLGEVTDAVLASQRVYPNRLADAGYEFRFPTLKPALADLLVAKEKG